MGYIKVCFFVFLMIGVQSCDDKVDRSGEKILARVGTKVLYESEIIAPQYGSAEDSLNVINSYIEQWVRRMIVLDRAEKDFPSDLNIDKLVEDYRSSLLLHNYRLGIVERSLDTLVGHEELEMLYKEVKGQYNISESVFRGILVKVPKGKPKLDNFYRDLKSFNYDIVSAYADRYSSLSLLDTVKWYSKGDFLNYLPSSEFSTSSIYKEGTIRKKSKEYEYFVKIIEYVDVSSEPPLSYIEDKLKRIIINQRKEDLLDNIESKLYKDALNGSKIKVYTN